MSPPDRPDYLPGRGAYPQVGPDDLSWVGAEGEEDFTAALASAGYEPEAPIRLVIRAIVAAHAKSETPEADRARVARDREEAALAALVGGPGPGRRQSDRYELLLQIARKFLEVFWAEDAPRGLVVKGKAWQPALDPIIKAVVPDDHPLIAENNLDGGDNLRKVLRRNFTDQKDLLLARASSDNNMDRLDQRIKLKAALKALEDLGIASDLAALPAPRFRDENTPI